MNLNRRDAMDAEKCNREVSAGVAIAEVVMVSLLMSAATRGLWRYV
jgi:hypothetical protein